ncbi:hypothetical protein [Bacillus thuringiensis]|uniref:hypothetical protein n=1 Tax=Bacillus thuringiensis TaxID=1428 RepID=UPI0015D5182F|nr:hypothetical protein [Bacillus thuringiensis]
MVLDNIYFDMDKTPTLLGFLIDSAAKLKDQLKMACGRVFLFVIIYNDLTEKFNYALIL